MPHSRWCSAALAAGALSLGLAPLAALAEPTAASTHVVQPGETLWDIADNLGIDPARLVKLNGLDDANLLSVGQSLSVPGNGTRATPPAASSPAAPAVARAYTVADGDTLWAIAHQFGTTTSALVEANHLDDPDHLALGTQLVVPGTGGAAAAPAPAQAGANATAPQPVAANATAPQPAAAPPAAPRVQASPATSAAAPGRSLLVRYTVQPGETPNQIAHQFDVRADAVAQASGLDDPNRLSVGLVLKVPLPGKEHVVSAGETLRDIALQEKVDLGSLVDFNQLDDPELIRVGQVVLVPVPATQPAAAPVAPSSPPMAAAPADASASLPQAAAPPAA